MLLSSRLWIVLGLLVVWVNAWNQGNGNGHGNEQGNRPSNVHGNGPSDAHGNNPSNVHGNGPSDAHGKNPSNVHGNNPSTVHGCPSSVHGNGPSSVPYYKYHDYEQDHGNGNDHGDACGGDPDCTAYAKCPTFWATTTSTSTATATKTVFVTIVSDTTYSTTMTDTATETDTTATTNTTTETDTKTKIDTKTETDTMTTTDTSTITDTTMSVETIPTAPPACPTHCSMSVNTVNLVYWPTDQPYTYPSTYIDTELDYTFSSPSVYMVIPTIFGYNSAGRVGPSATNTIYELNLGQVSTMSGSATQQLTLNDLGTDCPQSEPASVIETQGPNSRCNPILVAPEPVKAWASPCNACGGFGMFDPPYAVAPLSGGLVQAPVTTTTVLPQPETETAGMATVTASVTPSVAAVTHAAPVVPVMTQSSGAAPGGSAPAGSAPAGTSLAGTAATIKSSATMSSSNSNPSTAPSPTYTGPAVKVTGGLTSLALSLLVSMCLL